jgi:hypothetical protein
MSLAKDVGELEVLVPITLLVLLICRIFWEIGSNMTLFGAILLSVCSCCLVVIALCQNKMAGLTTFIILGILNYISWYACHSVDNLSFVWDFLGL